MRFKVFALRNSSGISRTESRKSFRFLGAYVVLLLTFFVAVVCIGYGFCGLKSEIRHASSPVSGNPKSEIEQLPTIEEIQERIGAVPDGILGPETQRMWELALCNQYAARYFTAEHAENAEIR